MTDTAAVAVKPSQPSSLHNMSDGQLADEHRGQTFAKLRAQDRLEAIEAELNRRGVTSATGRLSIVTKHPTDIGLVDIKRLRADHPELCRTYAQPGTQGFWRSKTIKKESA